MVPQLAWAPTRAMGNPSCIGDPTSSIITDACPMRRVSPRRGATFEAKSEVVLLAHSRLRGCARRQHLLAPTASSLAVICPGGPNRDSLPDEIRLAPLTRASLHGCSLIGKPLEPQQKYVQDTLERHARVPPERYGSDTMLCVRRGRRPLAAPTARPVSVDDR